MSINYGNKTNGVYDYDKYVSASHFVTCCCLSGQPLGHRAVSCHLSRHLSCQPSPLRSGHQSVTQLCHAVHLPGQRTILWGFWVWSLWYRFYMDIMSLVWLWVIPVVLIWIWHAISAVLCTMLPCNSGCFLLCFLHFVCWHFGVNVSIRWSRG